MTLQHTATHCDTLQYPATLCSTLQHTATHCNTLQHTATHCNTLQHPAALCNTLQHSATLCNTLQHPATLCNTLQHSATPYNTLQHTATHCNTLQHSATHCNTLQHAATRLGVLWEQPLPTFWCATPSSHSVLRSLYVLSCFLFTFDLAFSCHGHISSVSLVLSCDKPWTLWIPFICTFPWPQHTSLGCPCLLLLHFTQDFQSWPTQFTNVLDLWCQICSQLFVLFAQSKSEQKL